MSKALEELRQLQKLLAQEKKEDLEQFKQLIQRLPLKERKEKGYTWYPVQVTKRGFTFGDRAYVVLQRNEEDTPNFFRSGKIVNLFCKHPEAYKPESAGVIHFVNKNKMKIILNSQDLPEWLDDSGIGVDLLFDDRTYVEMEKALKQVINAKGDRLAELRDILLGLQQADHRPIDNFPPLPHLNTAQQQAIKNIMEAQQVAIIHGPPGTGKTTTLVQAIELLTNQERAVLVTAPSNTAVDVLTERLAEKGLNVVRIGNISRVEESLVQHTLEAQLSAHPESKNIKKIKLKAADCRRKAQRFKRRFGQEERRQRYELRQEAKELSQWANQLEDRLIDQILHSAQVITATLVGASHPVLSRLKFRTVVIDEAAQALEPACWIPISRVAKVVLTGDPFQLPPTVKSREAEKGGLSQTLLEKSLKRVAQHSLLNVQYRMNEVIMGFSNQQFYQMALRAAEQVAQGRLSITSNTPLQFIDTAGCGFQEQLKPTYKSRFNPDEYRILREHLLLLWGELSGQESTEIAIISPYREQVLYIEQHLSEEEELENIPTKVATIDGFQGQESDVVYISLVRSNSKGEIGFLKDYRRMNVAMTRARKKLVMIGDSATIGNDTFYSQLLEYCEQHGEYQSAWEYMQ